jgi:PAS domain S-box-containing protein
MSILNTRQNNTLGFLGDSEVSTIIRNKDWSRHPLTTPENWPPSLRTAISMCLYAPLPQLILWGDELFQFYNDSYKKIHPIPTIGERYTAHLPEVQQVLYSGQPAIHANYQYSPIYTETGSIGGVLCTITDPVTAWNQTELLRTVIAQAADPIFILHGENKVLTTANEPLFKVLGIEKSAIGKPLPEIKGLDITHMFQDVYYKNKIIKGLESAFVVTNDDGTTTTYYFSFICLPVIEADGNTSGVMVIANDITTQVTAQKRLTESEKLFSALVRATSNVIYRMSPDWVILRQLEGKGFIDDTGAPIEHWIEHYIPLREQEKVWKKVREAIKNKSVFEIEHEVIQTDGTIGWAFSRAIPILNEKGDIIEWFGAASDITARIETQKALRIARDESDQVKRLLQAVSTSTPDLVYVFNLNYEFTYANKALLDMWGLTWEQSIGKTLLENGYEPWHAEMHEREIDQVVATKKSIRGEVSFPHAILGKRIYDYIFAPVFDEDGQVVAIAGTTRDISDLKAAEDALKHSEELFRSLTQSLPQLIWTADTRGYCDFFNDKWYAYTGSTPELSNGDGWATYLHPDHQSFVYARWQESLATGIPVAAEFQLRAKDGSYQWFYVLGSPIHGKDNEINRWVGTLTNIDEQKASQDRLEKLVRERTGELQRSNEDLQQFAHVASHDLKEPVRKVKLFTNRLEEDKDSHISANGRSYLNKINAATNRMLSMIEGVLGYSSMAGAAIPFEPVDLKGLLQQIEADLEVVIQQKMAKIIFDDLPVYNGASILLYQLFSNLIFNSLKFSSPDRRPVITITSSYQENKKTLEIVLQDNGIGFSPQYAFRIFQTFTRLHSKDQYEGTGLGLALCKKIVERHQGTITASGQINEGAAFTITLPVN